MASPILTNPLRNTDEGEEDTTQRVAQTRESPRTSTSKANKDQNDKPSSVKSRVAKFFGLAPKTTESSANDGKTEGNSIFWRKRASIAGQAPPGKASNMRSNMPASGNHLS